MAVSASGDRRAGIVCGTQLGSQGDMGVRRLGDLHAFQLTVEFKLEVYRLARRSAGATRDYRYRDHLCESAMSGESNIAEGWYRHDARQMRVFLGYALGSLGETQRRLMDGVHRGYFTKGETAHAMTLGGRALGATVRLRQSLEPFVKKR